MSRSGLRIDKRFAPLLLLFTQSSFAQQTFEVASVKPADPAVRRGIDFRVEPGGRLTATNVTLQQLIRQAYDFKRYQISGGPGWAESDRFDIAAKADGERSGAQMMAMLQTLLADRFKLKVHRDTKEGAVYLLVVAKGGHKLATPKNQDLRSRVSTFRTGSPQEDAITYVVKGENASVALLAERLEGELARPVIDRTGISGKFDFKVEFAADDSHTDAAASVFSAVEKQLGLKLEAGKGPVETLVIEHAEKPSAN